MTCDNVHKGKYQYRSTLQKVSKNTERESSGTLCVFCRIADPNLNPTGSVRYCYELLDPDPFRIRIPVLKFDDTIKGSIQKYKEHIPIHNYGYHTSSVVDPDPGGQRWPTKKRKKVSKFHFWQARCSLLRTEGFSYSLDVLYGDLGIR